MAEDGCAAERRTACERTKRGALLLMRGVRRAGAWGPSARSECAGAHMLKQPGHFTSMKKELGVWTRRLSLWRRCSSSRGGCRRSMSPIEMCACQQTGSAHVSRGMHTSAALWGQGLWRSSRSPAVCVGLAGSASARPAGTAALPRCSSSRNRQAATPPPPSSPARAARAGFATGWRAP